MKEELFKKLCQKAVKHFIDEEICPKILQILETKDWYIFTSGNSKLVETQPYSIKVSKIDGHIEEFYLPSDEGFKLLKDAKNCFLIC